MFAQLKVYLNSKPIYLLILNKSSTSIKVVLKYPKNS